MSDDHDVLADLQTRMAFQDKTIGELNDAIAQQQNQIDQLRVQLKHLHDKVMALEEGAGARHGAEKPPHY